MIHILLSIEKQKASTSGRLALHLYQADDSWALILTPHSPLLCLKLLFWKGFYFHKLFYLENCCDGKMESHLAKRWLGPNQAQGEGERGGGGDGGGEIHWEQYVVDWDRYIWKEKWSDMVKDWERERGTIKKRGRQKERETLRYIENERKVGQHERASGAWGLHDEKMPALALLAW